MTNTRCEEYYREDLSERYIFTDMEHLPNATYLGNDEWLGTDGKHYIVVD